MSAGVHARARGGCFIQRCQNKNPREDLGMWKTSCIGSVRGGLGEIWEKSVSWVESCLGRRRLTFAYSPRPCGGCARDVGGADGKVIIERLCISLPYVETFNSKVIKYFVLELRSRYVFFVFQDSYVLCIYVMNILCTFPIFMHGYVTIVTKIKYSKGFYSKKFFTNDFTTRLH